MEPVTRAPVSHTMTSVMPDREKEENLNKIGQHALQLVQQYQSEFSNRMQKWVSEFISQVKLLMLHH